MCTLEKHGRIYVLTLTGNGEHRLNPALLGAISTALAEVRSTSGRGCALITTSEGKFFSNGLDLPWASVSPSDRLDLMGSALRRAIADLISLPMPTVAAVTGHAVAAGGALALAHDYVVMRSDRGFFYMSEMDRGVPISRYVIELVRSKISDPRSITRVLLGAEKLTAAEAAKMGFIHEAHDGARGTLEAAMRLGEELAAKNWDGEVYASIRKSSLPAVCDSLEPELQSQSESRGGDNSSAKSRL